MVCWHSRADQVNEPVVATGRSPPHLPSKHEPDRPRRMRHPVSIYVEDIGLQDRAPAILRIGMPGSLRRSCHRCAMRDPPIGGSSGQ